MVDGSPRGLASQEYEENKEGNQGEGNERLRAYMEQYRDGGSSSDEEDGDRGDDDEVAEPLPYSQLENVEDDDDFGDFTGPVEHQIDDETLFACVLANMDRSEERRGGSVGSGSVEGLFSSSSDSVKEEPPARVSIPPLDDDKRLTIMATMSRMKVPTSRPTVDLFVDSLLQGLKNKT